MDAIKISSMLSEDTLYTNSRCPWYLVFTYICDGKAETYHTWAEDAHEHGIFSPAVMESPLTVVHIRQKRLYLERRTVSSMSVDEAHWRSLLDRFCVLPSFLELLHSNNGGTLAYTSYRPQASQRSGDHITSASVGTDAVAFHVGYKMADWGNDERAVYARCDFATGRSFVLVLGTDSCLGVNRVQQLLQARPEAHFLHVIHALHCATYDVVEDARWGVDYKTQELESITGIAALQAYGNKPLPPRELKFNRDLQIVADFSRNLAWGSAKIRRNFQAFLSHLVRYETICQSSDTVSGGMVNTQNIREACEMIIELAVNQHDQIQQLHARLDSQIDVTRTLMAQCDTRLNIEIAEAAGRDSELMRGIAAVTMIFLPATFVATFFSMVFFHVGDEHSVRLVVDQRIWLYPLVTVPLTFVIGLWYLAWSFNVSWKVVWGRVKQVAIR